MVLRNAFDVGATLNRARRAKGLSQSELANMLGVTRQWVASVEAGSANARLGLVMDALRCVDLLIVTQTDDSQALVDQVLRGHHD